MSRVLLFSLLLASLGAQAAVDPTQPPADLRPASSAAAPAALNLQAILRGAQGSRAVIDGRTLRVGDSHAGLRVLAIHAHSVLIERQGRQQLLRLAEPVVKPSR
ncbi:hypothetical protein [Pseudomonas sp. BMS12]|uniref:hypothetical protein n=1 Tax=Pseudomonas sp. BMS12 TaxID=1796033 RepID=UPI00083AEC97|nr:hypothetical protein [Pseudomonas sp. BMS12]